MKPKFICNGMLGKLCKLLRMCGIDTEYSNEGARILLAARKEGRIVLTRNTHLKDRTHVTYIDSSDPNQQLSQVITQFGLEGGFNPFSRCIECNGVLQQVSKNDIKGEVPYFTYTHFEEFAQCPVCHRVYWKGSHYKNMCAEMKPFFQCHKE
jgi:uncharacterized protein with PIN domain